MELIKHPAFSTEMDPQMDPKRRAIKYALKLLGPDPKGRFVVENVTIFEGIAYVTFADGAATEFREYISFQLALAHD